MIDPLRIIELTPDNILNHGICGYKDPERPGFLEKVAWFKQRYQEGLRIKSLYSELNGSQGIIEYIPGEFCWRPVSAGGYMFIHCLFVGFKKMYKDHGYASLLLDQCEKDALKDKLHGVAVVTRKSSFMVGKDIFLKRGYTVTDKAPPDFELLVLKFINAAGDPAFTHNRPENIKRFAHGLTIIRADQCPYTVKNVREISNTAKSIFGLKVNIVDLDTYREAQKSPCPFGVFCILYNGIIIAEHPISNTRFINIMKNVLKN